MLTVKRKLDISCNFTCSAFLHAVHVKTTRGVVRGAHAVDQIVAKYALLQLLLLLRLKFMLVGIRSQLGAYRRLQ